MYSLLSWSFKNLHRWLDTRGYSDYIVLKHSYFIEGVEGVGFCKKRLHNVSLKFLVIHSFPPFFSGEYIFCRCLSCSFVFACYGPPLSVMKSQHSDNKDWWNYIYSKSKYTLGVTWGTLPWGKCADLVISAWVAWESVVSWISAAPFLFGAPCLKEENSHGSNSSKGQVGKWRMHFSEIGRRCRLHGEGHLTRSH